VKEHVIDVGTCLVGVGDEIRNELSSELYLFNSSGESLVYIRK